MMAQPIRLILNDWLYAENQCHRLPFIQAKVKVRTDNYIVATNSWWFELEIHTQKLNLFTYYLILITETDRPHLYLFYPAYV